MPLKENEPIIRNLSRHKGIKRYSNPNIKAVINGWANGIPILYDEIKKKDAICFRCKKRAFKKARNGWWYCKEHYEEGFK